MAISVDIFIEDDTVSPEPISGVVVSILDSVTLVEIAQATTDGDGLAAFLLPGAASPGTTYEVRCFKLGVRFANPFQIQVLEPLVAPSTNQFDVTGTLLTLAASVDARRCKCTGRFMNFSNDPIYGTTVRIMAKTESGFQVPKVVDGNLVSAEVLEVKTDVDGYVSVELLRTGEYYVTFAGEDETVWNITVPDRSSVNLIDLIHPRPVSLSWDSATAPGNALSVAVGETKEVEFSVLFSDYQELTTGVLKFLTFTNSDTLLMSVTATDGILVITGIAAGSASVTVEATPGVLPARIPDNVVTAPALVVTVTA